MNLLISLVLTVLGIVLIIFSKKLGLFVYRTGYIPAMKIYEKFFGWKTFLDEEHWYTRLVRKTARIAVIFIGAILFLMAYSIYFGQK